MNSLDWSQFDKGVFLINVLGIVYDPKTKKILIGRRENDPYIKNLSWAFPGGRPAYDQDLEFYLKNEIKNKTGIKIEIKKIVFAKTYPENRKFLSIYYLCHPISGAGKANKKFVELKWIKPAEVKNYFTTSLHPELFKYLETLD